MDQFNPFCPSNEWLVQILSRILLSSGTKGETNMCCVIVLLCKLFSNDYEVAMRAVLRVRNSFPVCRICFHFHHPRQSMVIMVIVMHWWGLSKMQLLWRATCYCAYDDIHLVKQQLARHEAAMTGSMGGMSRVSEKNTIHETWNGNYLNLLTKIARWTSCSSIKAGRIGRQTRGADFSEFFKQPLMNLPYTDIVT